jgi:hypothetical protein
MRLLLLFEVPAKFAETAVKPGANRGRSDVEQLSDLGVRTVQQVPHHDHGADWQIELQQAGRELIAN